MDYRVADLLTHDVTVRNGKVLFWLHNGSGRPVRLTFEGSEAYRIVLRKEDGGPPLPRAGGRSVSGAGAGWLARPAWDGCRGRTPGANPV